MAKDMVTKATHSKSLTCTHCEDERVFNKGVRDQKHSAGAMLPLPVWQCNTGLKNITRIKTLQSFYGELTSKSASAEQSSLHLFQVHVQNVAG